MDAEQKLPADGTRVRAKRAGWDEELSAEQEYDLDPVERDAGDDLEGPIVVVRSDVPPVGPVTVVLVDRQEADPDTVEEV